MSLDDQVENLKLMATDYQQQFYSHISNRLIAEHGFKHKKDYLNSSVCPECGNRTLWAKADKPTFIGCSDESCDFSNSIAEFLPDIYDDFCQTFPQTDADSNATANAYFTVQKGIPLEKVAFLGFEQNSFSRDKTDKITATVRFHLNEERTLWWEHLIEPVALKNYDGIVTVRTDNFSEGSLKDIWWQPPNQEIKGNNKVYLCDGILNAIALIVHGFKAVALLNKKFPENQLKPFLGQKITWVFALTNDITGRKRTLEFYKKLTALGESVTAIFMAENCDKRHWHEIAIDWTALERIAALRDTKLTNSKEEKEELIRLEKRYQFSIRNLNKYRYFGSLELANTYEKKAFLMWAHRLENSTGSVNKPSFFCFGYSRFSYEAEIEKLAFMKKYYELTGASKMEISEISTQEAERFSIDVDDENQIKAFNTAAEIIPIATFEIDFLHFLQPESGLPGQYIFKLLLANKTPSELLAVSDLTKAEMFKKSCQNANVGANWMGSNKALDWYYNYWTRHNPPRVKSINYVGYHEDLNAYIFDTCAIYRGRLLQANEDGFFKIGRRSVKTTTQLKTPFKISSNFKSDWYNDFKTVYGIEGVTVLAWWTLTLFTRQINKKHKGIPYFSLIGESGSGKTYLINFLWKLLGQEGESMAFNPSPPTTERGYVNWMLSFSGLPVTWNEVQNEESLENAREMKRGKFDMNRIKPLYDQERLSAKSFGGNMTHNVLGETFKAALMITQNPDIQGISEAIITRIVQKVYNRTRKGYKTENEKIARRLYNRPIEECSGFIFKVLSKADEMLHCFDVHLPDALSVFEDEILDYSHGVEMAVKIKHPRIREGHAKILAMAHCLPLIIPEMTDEDVLAVRMDLLNMAVKRQAAIEEDNHIIDAFWAFFDEHDQKVEQFGTSEKVVYDLCNHAPESDLKNMIAVHLPSLNRNEDFRKAGLDINDLHRLFPTSKNREYIGYKTVRSTLRNADGKLQILKCYCFKKPK